MKLGIYDALPAADYHADFDSRFPTLSSSIANVLLTQSPLHAWTQHPRLNPDYQPKTEEKFDVGTVAHALLLEGMAVMDVHAFPDWRTKAAKEARDVSRANGRIPLLTHQAHDVTEMVNAVGRQLAEFDADPVPLTGGKPEQTMVWEEDGVLCRARIDWLHDDLSAIDDVKTTSRSAHPDAFSKNLYGFGCDVQAAFYLRGMWRLNKFGNSVPKWRWIVVETTPPYGLSVVEPGPAVLELANAKVDAAIAIWKRCLETDTWPGYPQRVATAELPAWEEARWLAREEVGA